MWLIYTETVTVTTLLLIGDRGAWAWSEGRTRLVVGYFKEFTHPKPRKEWGSQQIRKNRECDGFDSSTVVFSIICKSFLSLKLLLNRCIRKLWAMLLINVDNCFMAIFDFFLAQKIHKHSIYFMLEDTQHHKFILQGLWSRDSGKSNCQRNLFRAPTCFDKNIEIRCQCINNHLTRGINTFYCHIKHCWK